MARDVALALLSSIMTVLATVALAAMVFRGPAAPAIPLGFMAILLGSAISGVIAAGLSRFPCNIVGAQDQPAAILGAVAASLAPLGLVTVSTAVSTLFAIIVLSTALFGISLVLLGSLKLGKLAQLVPYPVIGGFLAGVGILVLSVTLGILVGHPVKLTVPADFMSQADQQRWVPAFVVAVLLYFGMKRIRHVLFLPTALLVVIAVFHLSASAWGKSLESLRDEGWLFATMPENGFLDSLGTLEIGAIDGVAIMNALPEIGALVLLCVMGSSLAITALEVGTEVELEPNHELRGQGYANIAAAFVGCIPCFTLTSSSIAYFRLGASTRWMPALRALFILPIGLAGLPLVAYVPKMAVGVLLFLIAFGFISEWLIAARRKMALLDYALILIIVAIIVVVGFLEGITAGIFIAALFFLVKYSRLSVLKAELSGSEFRSDVERPFRANDLLTRHGDRLVVFELQGYIFFGSAISLLEHLRARIAGSRRGVRYVVLGFQHVSGLDASASFALNKLKLYARANDITLLFSALDEAMAAQLIAAGVMETGTFGLQRFHQTGHALEWVEEQLLAEAGYVEGDNDPVDLLTDMLGDPQNVANIMPYLTEREVAQGESLFREGDADEDIFILLNGQLSAIMNLDGTGIIRLRKFSPGSIVGEMSFYGGGHRTASLVADTPARVFIIKGRDLELLKTRFPLVAAMFHEMIACLMAQRLRAMNLVIKHLLA